MTFEDKIPKTVSDLFLLRQELLTELLQLKKRLMPFTSIPARRIPPPLFDWIFIITGGLLFAIPFILMMKDPPAKKNQ